MAYTLNEFCAETRAILKADLLAKALPQISDRLSQLLTNPAFVAETFNNETPVGKRELYHDPETDFYVLAHVQEAGKTGKPHSHGASWAIYGNARELTEMTEWRRVNAESDAMPNLSRQTDMQSGSVKHAHTARASCIPPLIPRKPG